MLYRIELAPSYMTARLDHIVESPAHHKGTPPQPLLDHAASLARQHLHPIERPSGWVDVTICEFCPTIVDRHARVTNAVELELTSFTVRNAADVRPTPRVATRPANRHHRHSLWPADASDR